MPIMQMHDVRQWLAGRDPRCCRRAKECELVRVACEGTRRVVADVYSTGAVLREQFVVEDNIVDAVLLARNPPNSDLVGFATKLSVNRIKLFCAGQLMKAAIRRRRNKYVPAFG